MFNGDWQSRTATLILSIALLSVIFTGILYVVSSQYAEIHQVYARYQKTSKNDQRVARQKIADTCKGLTKDALSECIANGLKAYADKQHSNQDLKAQQDMALWAFWMFVSSLATIVVTGVGVYYVAGTLELTRVGLSDTQRAADAAAAQVLEMRREKRPWISISAELRNDLIVSSDKLRLTFALNVRNAGTGPAMRVDVFSRIFNWSDEGLSFLKDFGSDHRARYDDRKPDGISIFPDDPYRTLNTSGINEFDGDGLIMPVLAISCLYQAPGDTEVYQSTRAYLVSSGQPLSENAPKTIAVSDLRLDRILLDEVTT